MGEELERGKSKFVLKSLFGLGHLSGAMCHDDVCNSSMQTVDSPHLTFAMQFEEALKYAVFMQRFLIQNKLKISAKVNGSSMNDGTSDFRTGVQ